MTSRTGGLRDGASLSHEATLRLIWIRKTIKTERQWYPNLLKREGSDQSRNFAMYDMKKFA